MKEKSGYFHTVWKCGNFPFTQILREINFGDSRSAKYAILTHFETPNSDFYKMFALFEGLYLPNQQNLEPLKWQTG